MEGKKISFGFMKTKKVEKLPVQEKKDFIECVEEKSIKVVGGEDVKEIAPLVIPMKPNTLVTTERLKQIAEKVESALEESENNEEPFKQEEKTLENETLEQMAVRELLEDSKKEVKVHTPQLKLVLPAKSVSSGEKESTLDDYESVPIQDFGLAMLRGMGWTKTDEKSSYKPPQLRPKGLGLGADKVVKDNNKQMVNKNSKEEELTIVKNAFVKITTGKHSGYYGKVMSLDEDNGRVMVDITVKKETVSLSEFMMHPVTKSEFDKESKVINANSFDQYKKNEDQKSSRNSEKEPARSLERNRNDKETNSSKENNNRMESEKQSANNSSKERNRDRSNREKYQDSKDDKYTRSNKRYSSNDSLSNSDSEKNRKRERKSKKQYSSMESLDSDKERSYKTKERERNSDRKSKKHKERIRYDSNSDNERKSKKSEKERRRHDSDSEPERRKKDKDRKRYDSDSESDHRIRKKSESDYERRKRSDTPDGKRDIDKKRKGKKKKRDRDRSPNHRRHRK